MNTSNCWPGASTPPGGVNVTPLMLLLAFHLRLAEPRFCRMTSHRHRVLLLEAGAQYFGASALRFAPILDPPDGVGVEVGFGLGVAVGLGAEVAVGVKPVVAVGWLVGAAVAVGAWAMAEGFLGLNQFNSTYP